AHPARRRRLRPRGEGLARALQRRWPASPRARDSLRLSRFAAFRCEPVRRRVERPSRIRRHAESQHGRRICSETEGKYVRRVLAAAGLAALCYAPAFAQPRIDYAKLEIKTTDLGHGAYLLGWQGGDSLILVGDEGVLLVDTSVAQMGDKIKAAIAKDGALIVAHEGLRERMAKGQYLAAFNQTIPPSPPAALPKVTYVDAMTLHFDGETVELVHVPNAHTDNDTLVHFKRANVIHASGTFGGDSSYPFFDMSSGGSLVGTIAAEAKMLSLADANTKIQADE